MKNILYNTLYIFVLLLALTACKKESEEQPPAQPTTAVTIENYNRITVGMPYSQVIAILGEGRLTSTNNYSWSTDNSNTVTISITFSNGAVYSKSQTGLASSTPSGGCPATYNGHTVYTGPRGGCYYINSNGNKTYI
jgi:hypothetical protein